MYVLVDEPTPPSVVTERIPLTAPTGTVMTTEVADLTLKSALTPPTVAAVTPPRLVPVTVMSVPTLPDAGVKLVRVGATGVAPTVKLAVLVPTPPAVVTEIEPLVPPVGTAVTIDVLESTVKDVTEMPLSLTAVVPTKLAPVSVTVVPTPPVVGVNEVTVGTLAVALTVKLVALVTTPPYVVTATGPVVAPDGTDVAMDVAETTTKGALVPLNFTDVVPVKLVPVMVTPEPTPPVTGVKLVIVGAGTVKLLAEVPVPTAVVTLIGPVVAPAGTFVLIVVAVLETIRAETPLKVTAVALPRLVPVMVTGDPTNPVTGVKLVNTGTPITVKLAALVPVPLGAVTLILPVVAPTGTTVVMDVADTAVNDATGVVLNMTAVTPSKLAPVMVTAVPTAAVIGENAATVGAGTVKFVADDTVPKAVVTPMGPVVALTGTLAVMTVAVFVTIVAAMPLKVTAVALPRLVPVMVTVLPTAPLTGVKLVIVGGPMTVKLAALVPVPLGAVTLILPVVAPTGMTVVMDVADTTVNDATGVVLNMTVVTPSKLEPVMVTAVPAAAVLGEKAVTVGAGTVIFVADDTVPKAVVTLMGPVVAVTGTLAVMAVAVLVTIVAAMPLKVTAVALPRLVPVMVTVLPTAPLTGVKLVIVGGPMTVKLAALVPVPLGAVTLILPVVAPAGTTVVIDVAEATVNDATGVVLNITVVTPSKLVPVRVIAAPTVPDVGEKAVTVGAGTVKLATEVAVPAAVVTLIGPVVAPTGTFVLIEVAVLVTIVAVIPLKVTAVAPLRLVPVMVTVAPTTPETGVKLVIDGAAPVTVMALDALTLW